MPIFLLFDENAKDLCSYRKIVCKRCVFLFISLQIVNRQIRFVMI